MSERVEFFPINQGIYVPLLGSDKFLLKEVDLLEALVLEPHTVKSNKHDGLNEYLLVLSGSIDLTIEGSKCPTSSFSLVKIPSGSVHTMEVGGKETVILCFYRAAGREGE